MSYARRYGWILALGVVLIVGGAAWNEWRKASERASAEAFGTAVLTALEQESPAARMRLLSEIETSGAQTGIIQLLSAGELFETDRRGALGALQAASEDVSLPDAYRQLAMLKRIIAGGAEIPVAEREALLADLSQPGQPLRPMALEQRALLALEQGEEQTAIEILTDLLEQSDVTSGLRQRVSQLLVALGSPPGAG